MMDCYKKHILKAHANGIELEYGFICAILAPNLCHWFKLPRDHEFDFDRFVYQIPLKD